MMAKINITEELKDILTNVAYHVETRELGEASVETYFYFLFKSLLYSNEPRTVIATEDEVNSDCNLLRILDELGADEKIRLESELKQRLPGNDVKTPKPELFDASKKLSFDDSFDELLCLTKYYKDMQAVTILEEEWDKFDSDEIYDVVKKKDLAINPEDVFASFILDEEFNEQFSDLVDLFKEFGITKEKFEDYFSPYYVDEEDEEGNSEDFVKEFLEDLKKSGINLEDDIEIIKRDKPSNETKNEEKSPEENVSKQKKSMSDKARTFERISSQVNQLFEELDKGKKKRKDANIVTAEGVQPGENNPENKSDDNNSGNENPGGFDTSEFEDAGHNKAISTKAVDPNSKTPTLDQFAIDMTASAKNHEFDPVVGRDKEIEQIIEILCCRKKNNAVLTGDPGCGKTAIVEALATRIVEGNVPLELRDKRIFSLDLNALVSGTQYRGQYEQRLQDVIKEVTKNREIIVFIDELHNLIGNGSTSGSGDGANILKPYLARGEFQCIGSTTNDEYRKYIEKDGALKRRFSPVLIEEPTVDQTIQILKGLSKTYGDYHKVTYSDEVLEKCAIWSGKYINDRFFPDKAISVLDMASSQAKLNAQKNKINTDVLNTLQKELTRVNNLKAEKLMNSEFEEAQKLRDVGKSIQEDIEREKESLSHREAVEVTVGDVSSVISKISNVPIDNIMSSDLQKIKTMKSELERKIIGQDEAVKQLTMALQRNIFGLRDPKKPIASFLFVGPTGVGKSLISKLVAKEFMGSENNLITIACSEYMQDWAESKLLGSAPGYVGYTDSEPRLYVLKRKPYSVILIDEVEKSSSNLYNIWLNMLEEGEITLSTGEKVSCRNSIIIFTGNVGTKALELKGNGIGFGKLSSEEKKKSDESTVMKEVTKEFRPEFLNRLTKIVVFNSLGEEELDKIFGLELGKLQDRIKESQGFDLLVNDKIKKLIVSKCEPKYGARSLQRLITEYIEDSINNAMLEQEVNGKHIMVDMDDEENIKVSFS